MSLSLPLAFATPPFLSLLGESGAAGEQGGSSSLRAMGWAGLGGGWWCGVVARGVGDGRTEGKAWQGGARRGQGREGKGDGTGIGINRCSDRCS